MTEPRSKPTDSLISLREYFDRLLEAHDKLANERKEALELRLAMAATDNERRLHELNKLRGNVLTRQEYELAHAALSNELRGIERAFRLEFVTLNEWKNKQEGKASATSVVYTLAVAALGLIIAAISLAHQVLK